MQCKRRLQIVLLSVALTGVALSTYFLVSSRVATAVPNQINVTGRVEGCGDGVVQVGEECDGTELAGHSCITRGFAGGTLSCNPDCTFNTSACTTAPPPPPPPPPGGGGVGALPAPLTQVIFTGRAQPGSSVTLLRDAQVVATTVADARANFQISISGMSPGNYLFSLYSEDSGGVRSSPLTFPVGVTSGITVRVGGIFFAPTVAVDKSEVRRGDNIAIFGKSVPNAEITLSISSPEEFFVKTPADEDGVYLYNFDTSPLSLGRHSARSKAAYRAEISAFGKAVGFLVGTRNVSARPPAAFLMGDLNNDGRVNLIDFSIAAHWYKRQISAEFAIREAERLNGDGRVDLVDFSIMAFHWTG